MGLFRQLGMVIIPTQWLFLALCAFMAPCTGEDLGDKLADKFPSDLSPYAYSISRADPSAPSHVQAFIFLIYS